MWYLKMSSSILIAVSLIYCMIQNVISLDIHSNDIQNQWQRLTKSITQNDIKKTSELYVKYIMTYNNKLKNTKDLANTKLSEPNKTTTDIVNLAIEIKKKVNKDSTEMIVYVREKVQKLAMRFRDTFKSLESFAEMKYEPEDDELLKLLNNIKSLTVDNSKPLVKRVIISFGRKYELNDWINMILKTSSNDKMFNDNYDNKQREAIREFSSLWKMLNVRLNCINNDTLMAFTTFIKGIEAIKSVRKKIKTSGENALGKITEKDIANIKNAVELAKALNLKFEDELTLISGELSYNEEQEEFDKNTNDDNKQSEPQIINNLETVNNDKPDTIKRKIKKLTDSTNNSSNNINNNPPIEENLLFPQDKDNKAQTDIIQPETSVQLPSFTDNSSHFDKLQPKIEKTLTTAEKKNNEQITTPVENTINTKDKKKKKRRTLQWEDLIKQQNPQISQESNNSVNTLKTTMIDLDNTKSVAKKSIQALNNCTDIQNRENDLIKQISKKMIDTNRKLANSLVNAADDICTNVTPISNPYLTKFENDGNLKRVKYLLNKNYDPNKYITKILNTVKTNNTFNSMKKTSYYTILTVIYNIKIETEEMDGAALYAINKIHEGKLAALQLNKRLNKEKASKACYIKSILLKEENEDNKKTKIENEERVKEIITENIREKLLNQGEKLDSVEDVKPLLIIDDNIPKINDNDIESEPSKNNEKPSKILEPIEKKISNIKPSKNEFRDLSKNLPKIANEADHTTTNVEEQTKIPGPTGTQNININHNKNEFSKLKESEPNGVIDKDYKIEYNPKKKKERYAIKSKNGIKRDNDSEQFDGNDEYKINSTENHDTIKQGIPRVNYGVHDNYNSNKDMQVPTIDNISHNKDTSVTENFDNLDSVEGTEQRILNDDIHPATDSYEEESSSHQQNDDNEEIKIKGNGEPIKSKVSPRNNFTNSENYNHPNNIPGYKKSRDESETPKDIGKQMKCSKRINPRKNKIEPNETKSRDLSENVPNIANGADHTANRKKKQQIPKRQSGDNDYDDNTEGDYEDDQLQDSSSNNHNLEESVPIHKNDVDENQSPTNVEEQTKIPGPTDTQNINIHPNENDLSNLSKNEQDIPSDRDGKDLTVSFSDGEMKYPMSKKRIIKRKIETPKKPNEKTSTKKNNSHDIENNYNTDVDGNNFSGITDDHLFDSNPKSKRIIRVRRVKRVGTKMPNNEINEEFIKDGNKSSVSNFDESHISKNNSAYFSFPFKNYNLDQCRNLSYRKFEHLSKNGATSISYLCLLSTSEFRSNISKTIPKAINNVKGSNTLNDVDQYMKTVRDTLKIGLKQTFDTVITNILPLAKKIMDTTENLYKFDQRGPHPIRNMLNTVMESKPSVPELTQDALNIFSPEFNIDEMINSIFDTSYNKTTSLKEKKTDAKNKLRDLSTHMNTAIDNIDCFVLSIVSILYSGLKNLKSHDSIMRDEHDIQKALYVIGIINKINKNKNERHAKLGVIIIHPNKRIQYMKMTDESEYKQFAMEITNKFKNVPKDQRPICLKVYSKQSIDAKVKDIEITIDKDEMNVEEIKNEIIAKLNNN